MKLLIALCFVSLVGLSLAETKTYPRGCIYILGKCYRECEEGTHAYAIGCGHMTPEATCDNPNPVADTRGMICDYSACYCNPPTVRNTATNKCVPLEECGKKEEKKKEEDKKEEVKEEGKKEEVKEEVKEEEKKEEVKEADKKD